MNARARSWEVSTTVIGRKEESHPEGEGDSERVRKMVMRGKKQQRERRAPTWSA